MAGLLKEELFLENWTTLKWFYIKYPDKESMKHLMCIICHIIFNAYDLM